MELLQVSNEENPSAFEKLTLFAAVISIKNILISEYDILTLGTEKTGSCQAKF